MHYVCSIARPAGLRTRLVTGCSRRTEERAASMVERMRGADGRCCCLHPGCLYPVVVGVGDRAYVMYLSSCVSFGGAPSDKPFEWNDDQHRASGHQRPLYAALWRKRWPSGVCSRRPFASPSLAKSPPNNDAAASSSTGGAPACNALRALCRPLRALPRPRPAAKPLALPSAKPCGRPLGRYSAALAVCSSRRYLGRRRRIAFIAHRRPPMRRSAARVYCGMQALHAHAVVAAVVACLLLLPLRTKRRSTGRGRGSPQGPAECC